MRSSISGKSTSTVSGPLPLAGTPIHGTLPLGLGAVRHVRNAGTDTTSLLRLRSTLGPGIGGTFTTTSPAVYSARAEFGTWTAGTITLSSLFHPSVFPTLTDRTAAGSDARTAGGLGSLQLVTPLVHESTGSPPVFPAGNRHGGFARLSLLFVPEPARFVLLAAGGIVLGALGWRRRQR